MLMIINEKRIMNFRQASVYIGQLRKLCCLFNSHTCSNSPATSVMLFQVEIFTMKVIKLTTSYYLMKFPCESPSDGKGYKGCKRNYEQRDFLKKHLELTLPRKES